ncbi:leucine-rich repeat-containing G-protein coupled receptor 6-like isoform X2 [Antennarius striatus]|uniref:leucine-rich repeat-containing G-protein coupled receptor 6-like isoform X2 n=1 Tax=Antennarius striatus TaxID=241820 RepID=UPI0035B36705
MTLPLVLFLVLTWGGRSSSCPGGCRCEGVGMLQRVDCMNAGLRSVPSALSRSTFSLRLDANFISRLPASSFKGVPSLRYLWLDDNLLRRVPVLALHHLKELQALTLAVNRIRYVPDRAFASLHQMVVLHLHGNSIQILGRKSLVGLSNLETLDLSFNRINCFPSAVRNLRNLRELNLQSNNISVIPQHAFDGNPSIQTINIQNNPVHIAGPPSFRLQPGIHSFDPSSSLLLSLVSLTYLEESGHPELRVSPHHRESEMRLMFPCYEKSLTSDLMENSTPPWCPDSSLWFLRLSVSYIFIISIILNRPQPSSWRLLILLYWFRILVALSGSSIITTRCFCRSSLETDPGSGLGVVLWCLSSELLAAAVSEDKTWMKSCSQIGCFFLCCSTFAVLLLMLLQEASLCCSSFLFTQSALTVFNTFRFLFTIGRHQHKEVHCMLL